MFEQTFKNIDDILHKDAGCGSELDYVEQTSWILFLKYLDDLEKDLISDKEKVNHTSYCQRLQNMLRPESILNEAFAAIDKAKENAEKNLQNAREIFETQLQYLLTNPKTDWEEKYLGDVCSLITDGKHGDCENEENSGYYFLSAKDIRNGKLNI